MLAVDVIFICDAAPPPYYFPMYDRMLATEGSRSLGIEVGQLIAIASWLKARSDRGSGNLEATGMRSQAVASVASALDPGSFSNVSIRDGLHSWSEVFSRPVRYQDAPELFCLDLYRRFDLAYLQSMAGPVNYIN